MPPSSPAEPLPADGVASGFSTGFRAAVPADLTALVELVESAYRGERSRRGWSSEADLLDGQRTDVAMLSGVLSDPDTLVIVLEHDGSAVACCQLTRVSAVVTELGMFAVEPGRQDAGLGRRVLAEAERVAGARGASTLRLSVIEQRGELIGWYERRGYRRTGELAPFPYGDERFGTPRRDDLRFAVLAKGLPPGDADAARPGPFSRS